MISLAVSFVAGLAMFFAVVLPAEADDRAAANRLFVEAVTKWEEAASTSRGSPEALQRRVSELEYVARNLKRIVEDHSSSDLAVQLVIGERFGPLSIGQVERELRNARTEVEISHCLSDRKRRCSLADDLMIEALSSAVSMADGRSAGRPLFEIAHEQLEAGLFDAARETAEKIDSRFTRLQLLGRLAAAQTRAGLHDEALETVKSIDEAPDRASALRLLTIAQLKHGSLERALDTASRIEEPGEFLFAMSRVIVAQAESGLGDKAHETKRKLFERLEGLDRSNLGRITQHTIETVARALGVTSSEYSDFQSIRAEPRFFHSEEMHLIAVSMGALAAVYEDPGLLAQAFEKLTPTGTREERAFDAIAVAHVHTGLFDVALQIAQRIQRIEFHGTSSGVYSQIALAQADAGLFSEALKAAGQIEASDVFNFTHHMIAGSLAEAGSFDDALSIVGKMDSTWRSLTASNIARKQAQAGQFLDALSTAQRIEDEPNEVRALVEIARLQADTTLLTETLEKARAIDDGGNRATALAIIAVALSTPGTR